MKRYTDGAEETTPMFLRAGGNSGEGNYDTDVVSEMTALTDFEPTKTQQNTAEETDINVIVKRFGITGQMPQGVRVPTYADFEGVWDFRTAYESVKMAEDAFMQIPAEIRARFRNDAGAYVEFCSKESNYAEMEKMGLRTKTVVPSATDSGLKPSGVSDDKPAKAGV